MEPEEIIQLLRSLTVAQIRQALQKMSAMGDPAYDTISDFFIAASKEEPGVAA